MSRYQTYKGTIIAEGEISEAQQKAVDRVMDTMDLLYGSALMWILMMTKVPPDTRSYSSRGWCARAVAPSRALARCVTLGAQVQYGAARREPHQEIVDGPRPRSDGGRREQLA